MRLWHKDLINVLPRQQLIGQWRECCAIARNISVNGTPNHVLVNKIMDYPLSHFYTYGTLVCLEMRARGYGCDFEKFGHYFTYPHETVFMEDIFSKWHNSRYFAQCYHNLQEKHDCGTISAEEWEKIEGKYWHEKMENLIRAKSRATTFSI